MFSYLVPSCIAVRGFLLVLLSVPYHFSTNIALVPKKINTLF